MYRPLGRRFGGTSRGPSGTALRDTLRSDSKFRKNNLVTLEAANPNYEPIQLNLEEVVFRGKLLAVWRKV